MEKILHKYLLSARNAVQVILLAISDGVFGEAKLVQGRPGGLPNAQKNMESQSETR